MGQRPLAAGRLAGARWRMFERPTASAAAVAGSNLAARGVLKDCGVRFAAMAKDPAARAPRTWIPAKPTT
jgi:hypothetical protein